MLAERDRLNVDIQAILDKQTDAWGIKLANVEIKHVDWDESMIRAIARQAEAERERRAKVINAEGEFQAARCWAGGAHPRTGACRDTVALSAHPDRHRHRAELDHRVPDSPFDLLAPLLKSAESKRG